MFSRSLQALSSSDRFVVSGAVKCRRQAPFHVVLLVLFIAGCATDATRIAGEPVNLGVLKDEYRQPLHRHGVLTSIEAQFAAAEAYVSRRAPSVIRPAVVLDIDETALDNWQLILANDFGYITNGACDYLPEGPCSSAYWDRLRGADAFPGALHLFNTTIARGVAVFFITGRPERERDATIADLGKAGYAGWTGLIMKPGGEPSGPYKTAARIKVEQNGYTIIANVGDQLSDLEGGHAEKTFKIANPYYFIP